MSTNLESRARDQETEKVGGRQAKLNEKKGDIDLEREIKKLRRHFLSEGQHENFVAAVTK